MGLLDSLNPINLVKNAAESIVDSVLPDGLKSVGNDLVDVALDFVGGNYGGLANDVSSFLHDAETAMGPLTNLGAALPSPTTEPDAPPPADSKSANKKSSSTTKSDSEASDTKSAGSKTTSASKSDSKTTGETAPATTPIATRGDSSTATTDKSSSATDKSTSSTDKSTSKTSSSSSSSSSSSKSNSTSDAKDITKFFAQSDNDLMAAVRDGKLPDAVRDDPAAMQRLQLRMNEIAEMNQLISQMLAAMHDMNKAVIQNIRA